MKKSSTLMLSYIIFLVITIIIRIKFNWTGLGQVALAATIAGCFFAIADILNWYISYKKPLVGAMREDLLILKQYEHAAKEYICRDIEDSKQSIELLQAYADEDDRIKEFIDICKTSIPQHKQMVREIESYEFEMVVTEEELRNDAARLLGIGILEAIFATLGFVSFFVLLCFKAIVEIVIPYGETVTVLAFAIIMLTYFLRDILEDKARKDLADINKHIKQEKRNVEKIKAKMTENKCLETAKNLLELIETCKDTEENTDGQTENALGE